MRFGPGEVCYRAEEMQRGNESKKSKVELFAFFMICMLPAELAILFKF
jgi:hypothetical protein